MSISSGSPGTPKPRLLAVASHPIQYQAPLFRRLSTADEIDFSVLFVQMPDATQQGRGFGVPFTWDVPLLEGYRFSQVPTLLGDSLKGFWAARIPGPVALLRNLKPDAVMLTGWHIWPLVQMLFAARWLGIPVLMRGESNALRRRPWHARLLHRALLSQCRAFLPIGKASRAFYRGYGKPPASLFDTPYFVDNERFASAAAEAERAREELRQRWCIPPDATCFLYAGKLEHKKRILDVLEALRIAVSKAPAPLHLLVVGTGELMDAATRQVQQHALPVTFAGFLNQTQIPSAYVAADCLVLASDYGETWGLVVNEAMACGRAAIVSDRVGCGPDLIASGVTGEIFAFGDVQALAEAMLRAARHPETLASMGDAAKAKVMRDYSIERSAQGILTAVRYALARRP